MSRRSADWQAMLTPSLERAWSVRLRAAWQQLNETHASAGMRPPVLRIDRAEQRLGSWHGGTRTLTLSARHVALDPWERVLATLRHEMAHQYVDEVLKAHGETAHGDAFAHALARFTPDDADAAPDPDSARVLERVRKLLALAESDNAHEAEAAMAQAHRLLLRHNLALHGSAAVYQARLLGEARAALPLHAKMVAGLLTEFFFVEAVWILQYDALRDRDVRRLEIYGRPHDVEMAAYVHDYLHEACERLFLAARRRGELDGSARRDYLAGVLAGFRQKLGAERHRAAEQGLVWVGDGDLRQFVRQRHRHLRTLGSAGARRSRAHDLGRRDGARLTVHRPMQSQGGGGRALPAPER